MAKNPIYPIAYTIAPNQVTKLYYLSFPKAWKQELLVIAQKSKPRFKGAYGLPTKSLEKMVNNWMDGIVSLKALNTISEDEHWLSSYVPFTEKRLQILLGIIKAWVAGTYISQPKGNPTAKALAQAFNNHANIADLSIQTTDAQVVLSDDTGAIQDAGYQAIPLMAMNRLHGKDLVINGTTLHLCYSAKNELICRPIEDPKSHHYYSYVFQFSVQTTPPERRALLLCHMSIRRWVPGRYQPEKDVFASNAINVHVYVGKDKFCQVPIFYNQTTKHFMWNAQDQACYDLLGYEPLIAPAALWEEMERSKQTYLLPYKSGMPSMLISQIGVGVPVKDKASLYQQLLSHLSGIAMPANAAVPGPRRIFKLHHFASPQEYGSVEEFKAWFAQCAEVNEVTFEIYGLQSNPTQATFMDRLEQKLMDDFGENNQGTKLAVHIIRREAGTFQEKLESDNKNDKIKRCDEMVAALGPANGVVACFFLIPGANTYSDGGDPKQVIRNAFASTGRVVQFVVPSQEEVAANNHKIDHAVYDLYRQLGVTTLLDVAKARSHVYAKVRCIGMHICTQVHGIRNKGQYLPVYVDMDLLTGQTRVQCAAFDQPSVSYREACLEMARLFWKDNLEQLCVSASYGPAKQKLLALKNRHTDVENPVLLLVAADGQTRYLWGGISDKSICGYDLADEYIPHQIDVGSAKSPFLLPLENTGIRIMRIRSNAEVPDYFTEQQNLQDSTGKYSSATGVFQYGKTFWSIASKPNDPRFNRSFRESRIDHPTHDYAEKDMMEFYPLQLQKGDDLWGWLRFVNALQTLSIQYSGETTLPLPLHLAKNLCEYLFDA